MFNDDGVPVIVRFAHEMNGSWYAWSQQPQKYVAAFQTLAKAVHTLAPGSAMMWAPNYGGGYPFAGGKYEAKPGTP
ncbi:glycosyl hydrolase, partial [Paraburkholderia sp. SIMBA_027]